MFDLKSAMANVQPTSGLPPQGLPGPRAASPVTKEQRPVTPASVPLPRSVQDVPPVAVTQADKPQLSPEELKRITQEFARKVNAVVPELEFSIDQSSGRTIIKITDPATGEVIQQIPSEDALRLNEALDRFEQGLLLNRKA